MCSYLCQWHDELPQEMSWAIFSIQSLAEGSLLTDPSIISPQDVHWKVAVEHQFPR